MKHSAFPKDLVKIDLASLVLPTSSRCSSHCFSIFSRSACDTGTMHSLIGPYFQAKKSQPTPFVTLTYGQFWPHSLQSMSLSWLAFCPLFFRKTEPLLVNQSHAAGPVEPASLHSACEDPWETPMGRQQQWASRRFSDQKNKRSTGALLRTVKVDQFNRIVSNLIGAPLDQEVK